MESRICILRSFVVPPPTHTLREFRESAARLRVATKSKWKVKQSELRSLGWVEDTMIIAARKNTMDVVGGHSLIVHRVKESSVNNG